MPDYINRGGNDMYRLLIVDDERHIVNWLYELFMEKSTLEFDIFKAYSGREGLEILNRVKIDIILTDIRMPGMSGLELMEKIHENWVNSKVIFLTGFNEFDYIYKATKYEGVSYILKTEDDDVIINAVEKAVESIEKELKNDEIASRAVESDQLIEYLMQREVLKGILEGQAAKKNKESNGMGKSEVLLDFKKPAILMVGWAGSRFNEMGYMEQLKTMLSIKYLTEKYFGRYILYEFTDIDENDMLWLMQPHEEAWDSQMKDGSDVWDKPILFIREMLETFQKACRETLNLDISFLLYQEPACWDTLSRKLDMIKSVAGNRIGFNTGTSVIFTISGNEECDVEMKNEKELMTACSKIKNITLLQGYLEQGQRKEFFDLFTDITGCIRGVSSKHNFPAIEVYYSLSLMFMTYINRYCLLEKLSFRIGLNKLTNTDEFGSWEDAVDYLSELGDAIFELQKNEQQSRDNDVIKNIKGFVKENIAGELSLVRISESVNYNPSYISRIFKQINGINLFDYINKIRIEKSMDLLEKTSDNIQNIAKAVGFDSSQYFATFFKKRTGMTPQEYRNLYLRTSK